MIFQGGPDPLSPALDPHMVSSLDNSTSLQSCVNYPVSILLPWICHNGMSYIFVTVRDIGYSEKKNVEIFISCLFTYPPPPPSKQTSTIHGYFVSATPHTVIRLLLIHSSMFLPFVYSPSLVLVLSCIPLCPL